MLLHLLRPARYLKHRHASADPWVFPYMDDRSNFFAMAFREPKYRSPDQIEAEELLERRIAPHTDRCPGLKAIVQWARVFGLRIRTATIDGTPELMGLLDVLDIADRYASFGEFWSVYGQEQCGEIRKIVAYARRHMSDASERCRIGVAADNLVVSFHRDVSRYCEVAATNSSYEQFNNAFCQMRVHIRTSYHEYIQNIPTANRASASTTESYLKNGIRCMLLCTPANPTAFCFQALCAAESTLAKAAEARDVSTSQLRLSRESTVSEIIKAVDGRLCARTTRRRYVDAVIRAEYGPCKTYRPRRSVSRKGVSAEYAEPCPSNEALRELAKAINTRKDTIATSSKKSGRSKTEHIPNQSEGEIANQPGTPPRKKVAKKRPMGHARLYLHGNQSTLPDSALIHLLHHLLSSSDRECQAAGFILLWACVTGTPLEASAHVLRAAAETAIEPNALYVTFEKNIPVLRHAGVPRGDPPLGIHRHRRLAQELRCNIHLLLPEHRANLASLFYRAGLNEPVFANVGEEFWAKAVVDAGLGRLFPKPRRPMGLLQQTAWQIMFRGGVPQEVMRFLSLNGFRGCSVPERYVFTSQRQLSRFLLGAARSFYLAVFPERKEEITAAARECESALQDLSEEEGYGSFTSLPADCVQQLLCDCYGSGKEWIRRVSQNKHCQIPHNVIHDVHMALLMAADIAVAARDRLSDSATSEGIPRFEMHGGIVYVYTQDKQTRRAEEERVTSGFEWLKYLYVMDIYLTTGLKLTQSSFTLKERKKWLQVKLGIVWPSRRRFNVWRHSVKSWLLGELGSEDTQMLMGHCSTEKSPYHLGASRSPLDFWIRVSTVLNRILRAPV